MLFNSWHFFVFFIIITTTYFLIPHKYRWFLLLASSCWFYMAFVPIYILILGFTIVVDYFAGLYLEKTEGRIQKFFFIVGLAVNILILAAFKYYNFINNNITAMLSGFHVQNPFPVLTILLPIGLSFHTFQAMSYIIEVYRGEQKAEHNFGIYALYVMFYPQLVAGPIERPQNLLHQFYEEHHFDYKRVTDGLKLMAWGLFKKAVIADRVASFVSYVYDKPYEQHGFSLLIATFMFAFQIFCDFSGYSDMAIGAAQVMGFDLMKNFNRPYHSRSVTEFWRRWHISLSTWLLDYVFKPMQMGMRYYGLMGNILTILVTFLISGIWHGANWTFVIWGGLQGLYLIIGLLTKPVRAKMVSFIRLDKFPKVYHAVQVAVTFSLITFSWIFFRAKNVSEAFYIVKTIAMGFVDGLYDLVHRIPLGLELRIPGSTIIIATLAIALMETVHVMQNKYTIREWIRTKPLYFRWLTYYSLIMLILLFGVFEDQQFIYFQF